MADNRYRWLDGTAAEHLLRGEAADALAVVGSEDEQAREQALRLAAAMTAVAELPVVVLARDGDLPGEAAAMRAFRLANSGTGRASARRGARRAPWAPSFGRPLWAGLGVALSAALLGGAALAAGALPRPFGGGPDPVPATSVSAVGTPRVADGAVPESPKPSHGEGRGTGHGKDRGRGPSAGDGHGPSAPKHGGEPGSPQETGSGDSGQVDADVCRKYRDGTLDEDRKRSVEKAAGGRAALDRKCDSLLGGVTGGDSGGDTDDGGKGKGAKSTPEPTPTTEPEPSPDGTIVPSPQVSLRLGTHRLPLGS